MWTFHGPADLLWRLRQIELKESEASDENDAQVVLCVLTADSNGRSP